MAKTEDYGLGEHTFPRGWFMVAEACELDEGPKAVRFFGNDFALYRGKESGQPILLDAYCPHMGTHLTANESSYVIKNGIHIEGDSIRCPYHAWRFGPDGKCNDIPGLDCKAIPQAAQIRAWTAKESMGCIFVWHDPEGGEPDYDVPFLDEWDDPQWVHWKIDHLGSIETHPQEVLDNMADARHLGPTHGAPCQFFNNTIKDHVLIQRQGGYSEEFVAHLSTYTWYTGPGILLSKQSFGEQSAYEIITNTPVDDGVTQVWHGVLARSPNKIATEEDVANARIQQAGALHAFAQDFDVWCNKRPAIQILAAPHEGAFAKSRTWYKQFYNPRAKAHEFQKLANGQYSARGLDQPPDDMISWNKHAAIAAE